jgi:hypothetical protein
MFCGLSSAGLPSPAVLAQAPGPARFAESVVANVVRIQAGDRAGFGFIVGLERERLIIATALHTLKGAGDAAPLVCLAPRGDSCAEGSLLYIADAVGNLPALDLAFLTVPYPDDLAWRPDAMAASAPAGTPVRSIGRGRTWYVPETAGRVEGEDAETRLVRYTALTLAQGVSGAPIVSEDGIIAMHVQSQGDDQGAQGIAIDAIRERLTTQARGRWVLLPRAECEASAVHRGAIAGRTIVLHFSGADPDQGLRATSLLHCLGATVLLRPVWDSGDWPGGRVVYGSGAVRLVRALQSALASVGRLDTVLGAPRGDAELWIR